MGSIPIQALLRVGSTALPLLYLAFIWNRVWNGTTPPWQVSEGELGELEHFYPGRYEAAVESNKAFVYSAFTLPAHVVYVTEGNSRLLKQADQLFISPYSQLCGIHRTLCLCVASDFEQAPLLWEIGQCNTLLLLQALARYTLDRITTSHSPTSRPHSSAGPVKTDHPGTFAVRGCHDLHNHYLQYIAAMPFLPSSTRRPKRFVSACAAI